MQGSSHARDSRLILFSDESRVRHRSWDNGHPSDVHTPGTKCIQSYKSWHQHCLQANALSTSRKSPSSQASLSLLCDISDVMQHLESLDSQTDQQIRFGPFSSGRLGLVIEEPFVRACCPKESNQREHSRVRDPFGIRSSGTSLSPYASAFHTSGSRPAIQRWCAHTSSQWMGNRRLVPA